MDETIPIEIAFEKVKAEILDSINSTIEKSGLPSSIIVQLYENVLLEVKANTYAAIIQQYDILNSAQTLSAEPAAKKSTETSKVTDLGYIGMTPEEVTKEIKKTE